MTHHGTGISRWPRFAGEGAGISSRRERRIERSEPKASIAASIASDRFLPSVATRGRSTNSTSTRPSDPVENFAAKAQDYANELRELTGSRSFEVFSTRRQIARYLEWFNELAATVVGPINGTAEAIFSLLPESEEPDWNY